MMKTWIYRYIFMAALGAWALGASAQKFAVKPHAEVDLTAGFGYDSALEMNAKTASNEFGLDFGYTFLNKTGNRLEVNVGLGYRYLNTSLNAGNFGYDYDAPASADVDGNAYIRFCEVSGLRQKASTGYVTLPVYLQYGYRATNWLEVQALTGVKLGFATGGSLKTTSGTVDSYGIFPEYDDLLIDEPYIDDFGEVGLKGRDGVKPETAGFGCWVMVGAGLSARVYGPVWFDLGVRYNIGLTDVFGKGLKTTEGYTASTSPVTYTVADGTRVRPLTAYLTKSTFSPLTLNIGITLRF